MYSVTSLEPLRISTETLRAVLHKQQLEPESADIYFPATVKLLDGTIDHFFNASPIVTNGQRLILEKRDDGVEHVAVQFTRNGKVERTIRFLEAYQSEEIMLAFELFYASVYEHFSLWTSCPVVQEQLGHKTFCINERLARELLSAWLTSEEQRFTPTLTLPTDSEISQATQDLLPFPQTIKTSQRSIEWTQSSTGYLVRQRGERGALEHFEQHPNIESARAGLVKQLLIPKTLRV